jgi:hypothetical protein
MEAQRIVSKYCSRTARDVRRAKVGYGTYFPALITSQHHHNTRVPHFVHVRELFLSCKVEARSFFAGREVTEEEIYRGRERKDLFPREDDSIGGSFFRFFGRFYFTCLFSSFLFFFIRYKDRLKLSL